MKHTFKEIVRFMKSGSACPKEPSTKKSKMKKTPDNLTAIRSHYFDTYSIPPVTTTWLPPANEVWGSIFTPVCHSVHRGEYLGRYRPPDQVHPPDKVHPQDQVHPSGPGTPPGTRYTPPGPGTPPRPGTPPGPGTPPDQVHPREQCMLGDTGNKWAVRILLECILVLKWF